MKHSHENECRRHERPLSCLRHSPFASSFSPEAGGLPEDCRRYAAEFVSNDLRHTEGAEDLDGTDGEDVPHPRIKQQLRGGDFR